MSKYDQLKKKKDDAFAGAKQEIDHMNILARESRRVADVAHNAGEIITDLDKQFAAATKLNGKDISFLFLATALQCTKWILMPEFDFNFNKNGNGNRPPKFTKNKEPEEIEEQEEQPVKKEKPYTWQQILLSPAPYLCDISEIPESESPLNNLFGNSGEHNGLDSWGNDPLFGWVFGTLNILSRTMTLRNMSTYDVALDRSSELPSILLSANELQLVPDSSKSIPEMISECYASFQQDPKRLFAAVAKQATRQFANGPAKFGVTLPLLCEHSPDEIADDMRNIGRWGKYKKDAWDESKQVSEEPNEVSDEPSDDKKIDKKQRHFGDYTAKAFTAYESVQGVAGSASDTIDKAQSYLDCIDGMDGAKSLLDKARVAVEKAQEYMNKPMEMFAEYASVPGEYLDKTQNVINSSREYISEARSYIKQACGIVGLISIDDGPIGKLFDEADKLLGGTSDMTTSIHDLLSNPQNLLAKIEELAEKGWNSFSSNELAKTIAKDIAILGLQVGISVLINALIRALHSLCCNETVDGDPKMYEVRTRKILSYSNVIASGSNIIYVAMSKNLKKLDIGGIAVTIYRVVTDFRFIQDLKREFLSKQWYDIVMGDDEIYKFLEEN